MKERLASVGAVIVHYHRERKVAELVRDLTTRHGIQPGHIVVVDNGSSGERLAAALEACDVDPVVIAQDNVGYGVGMNLGAGRLPSDVDTLVLLTHEVRLDAGCLTELVAALDSDQRIGIAGPLLLTPDRHIWSAGGELTRLRRLPVHRLQGETVSMAPGQPAECTWLDGAVLAVHRAVWRELDGLDERFFLYVEDVDFGLRVRQSGRKVVVVPAARAVQQPSGSIPPFLWTRNPLLLFRAHGMTTASLLWLLSALAGMTRDVVTRRSPVCLRQRIRGLTAGVANHGGEPPRRVPFSSGSGTR